MIQIKETLADKVRFAVEEIVENESIEEILKWLIQDSELIEVVSCLDMIAREDNKNIQMFDKNGIKIYPVVDSQKEI